MIVTSTIFRIWTSQQQSPKKVPAIPMAIPSCLFVSFSPSQPHLLPTFPKLSTSPLSHLPQLPNLTNFPPFRPSQPHHPPTFPTIPTSPPITSKIKALQNDNIRPSLSTLVFKRRFAKQNPYSSLLGNDLRPLDLSSDLLTITQLKHVQCE